MIFLVEKCPSCSDTAIKKIDHGELGDPAWIAEGWKAEDGTGALLENDQEIDFCPFCGYELNGEQNGEKA